MWDHYHDQHESMHAALKKRWMEVKDSKRLYPKIAYNTKNSYPMNSSKRNNKLANNMNNICNIWTSNSEIYQTLINSMV